MSVTLTNPNSAQDINYIELSQLQTADNYVRVVESSSTYIGSGVAGLHGLFVGEAQGGYGLQNILADQSVKTYATSASVLQCIRAAKKTFQLQPDKMRLTLTA